MIRPKRLPLATLLTAALAVVGVSACSHDSDSGSRSRAPGRLDNVILISIDSLRADHVGTYGYPGPTTPFIDALAREGLVFERAYSTASWTLPAHVAMLTGLDNQAHGVVDHDVVIPASVEPLAVTLDREGIGTVGFFSGPYMHPSFGFARGFGEYINCTSTIPQGASQLTVREHDVSSSDVTNPILLEKLRDWIGRGGVQRRNFVFIHMWDVHYDYIPPERYVKIFDPDYRGTLTGRVFQNPDVHPGMDPRDLQHLLALYDGEIRYTDDTLREIFDVLRGAGLLVRAAVIVTADHGDEFLEHGRTGHHHTLYEELLRVPLIVHVPGRTPGPRIDRIVSLIDIYPTICGWLGVRCPHESYGDDLMRLFKEGNRAATRDDALASLSLKTFGWRQFALVTPRGKVHRWPDVQRLPDLQTVFFDPVALREERSGTEVGGDLAGYAEPVRQAVRQLEARMSAAEAEGQRLRVREHRTAPELDEKTRERLRALGYLGG